jgi:hypothetical protein
MKPLLFIPIFCCCSILVSAQAASIYKIKLEGNGQEVTLFDRGKKEECCQKLPLTFQMVFELDAPAPYDRSTRTHTIEFMHLQQFFAFTISTRDGYSGLIQYDVQQQATSTSLTFLPQVDNTKTEQWFPAKNAIIYWNCNGISTRSMILAPSGNFTLTAYNQNDSLLLYYKFDYTESNIKVSTNNNDGVKMAAEKKQTNNRASFGDYVIVRRFEIPKAAKPHKVVGELIGLRERPNLRFSGFTEVANGGTLVAVRLGSMEDPSPWFKIVAANGEPIEAYVPATVLLPVGKIVAGGNVTKAAVDPQAIAGVSGRTRPKKPKSSTVVKKRKQS